MIKAINPVLNLKQWMSESEIDLKPPVGNKLIYENNDWIVMAVGGPNSRKDYHFHQRCPEFFYMVKGDMILKIMTENGPADSWGLVLEAKARQGQKDFLHWYCEKCNNKLHELQFDLTNIVTELPPLFDKFYSNVEFRTCKKCLAVMDPPKAVK